MRTAARSTRERRVRFERRDAAAAAEDDEEDADAEDEEVALHPVLQWDLDTVRWLTTQRENWPALETLVVATTSKYRTQDISLLLWLVFLAMLPDFGLPYLWMCVANLLAVLVLQYVAQVLRPLDVDPSLRALAACVDPDTYGFPCVDAHMAVVVLLPVVENAQSAAAQLAFVLMGVYVAATRLLVGARFVSQVVGSWFTGLTGVVMGNHGRLVAKQYKLTSGHNTAAIVLLLAFLMVVVGQWVENNESRVIGVPKADFMEVLGNLLRSDGAPTANAPPTAVAATTGSVATAARVHQMPSRYSRGGGSDDASQDDDGDGDDAASDEHRELLGRKDSFYFLLRAMRARQQPQRRATTATGSGSRLFE